MIKLCLTQYCLLWKSIPILPDLHPTVWIKTGSSQSRRASKLCLVPIVYTLKSLTLKGVWIIYIIYILFYRLFYYFSSIFLLLRNNISSFEIWFPVSQELSQQNSNKRGKIYIKEIERITKTLCLYWLMAIILTVCSYLQLIPVLYCVAVYHQKCWGFKAWPYFSYYSIISHTSINNFKRMGLNSSLKSFLWTLSFMTS